MFKKGLNQFLYIFHRYYRLFSGNLPKPKWTGT